MLFYVFVLLLFVCQSSSCQYPAPVLQNRLDSTNKVLDTNLLGEYNRINSELGVDKYQLEKVLEEWRRDSLTCIGLRGYFKAKFLVDNLNFLQKTKDEVILLLGQPNALLPYHSGYADAERNPEDYVQMRYYYGLACKDGMLITKGTCWLEFVVNRKSEKVKRVDFVCE